MAKTADEGAGGKGVGGEDSATFECNICLDTARDAVISFCGHLFCWPCLHQWLEIRPQRPVCPVCKAGISRDKVIPVYGRGGSKEDPRDKMPPRPPGQRTEPEATARGGAHNFGFGDTANFQMSFGIGGFPFGLFASTFNFGVPMANDRQAQTGPDLHSAETRGVNFPVLFLLLLSTLDPVSILLCVMFFVLARRLELQDQLVSKMFIWLACIFLLWLIVV